MKSSMGLRGKYRVERYVGDKHLGGFNLSNAISDSGTNYFLSAAVTAATQLSSWFIGLINSTGFTAASVANTLASHAGWVELTTYSESARPQWSPSLGTKLLTNATATTFTFNAAGVVQGFFVASDSTKNGAAGTLLSLATFRNSGDTADEPKTVTNGEVWRVTYTIEGIND